MRKLFENLSSKTKSVLKKGTVATLCTFMIGAGVFYACNKDSELNTTRDGKLMGNPGIWECTVTNPIGTIILPDGQEPPCTRYSVNRVWNEAKQRYTGFSHTTEIHKCEATDIFTTVEFVAELKPALLTGNNPEIDYMNVNNFILRVDNRAVTPTFSYEKPFEYNITTADGDVITMTGIFLVTYENVINVWREISAQIAWGSFEPITVENMRVFANQESLHAEIKKVSAMNEQALRQYEMSVNFLSFGRKAETIYYNIVAPYQDTEVGLSAEQAEAYVSQYPDYLELWTVVFDGEEEEEYDFVPKYDGNYFSYIMNESRMFQIKGIVYKVFDKIVIGLPKENMEILFSITEDNVKDEMNNHDFDVLCCDKKMKTQKHGTYYYSDRVDLESPVSSNGKEKITATFQSFAENSLGFYNAVTTYGTIFVRAKWRGGTKTNAWVNCLRTINTDMEMDINANGTIRMGWDKYKTPKTQYKHHVTVVPRKNQLWEKACEEFWHTVHYLEGKIWIATVTLNLDAPEVPIKKGR